MVKKNLILLCRTETLVPILLDRTGMLVPILLLSFTQFLKLITGQRYPCRFYPSCGQYFWEAISKFGVAKGAKLGILRILSCHPFGKFGIDEVS